MSRRFAAGARARLAGPVRRLRASHPVRVLRWLRNLMLVCVAGTLLLCLEAALVAHHRISSAGQTRQAIADIGLAYSAAESAGAELGATFRQGDPTLTGAGSDFAIFATQANDFITEAARESDALGASGDQELEFVQGQLATCRNLADTAVLEYGKLNASAVEPALSCLTDPDQLVGGDPVPDTGGLAAALQDLQTLEQQTLDAQRTSFWLHPLRYVWLLLAPSIALLCLLIATDCIVARHFRRTISPLLPAAVAATAADAVLVGILGARDDAVLSTNPWAAHPVTLTCEGALLVGAGVLIHLGYRLRLAEYRFHPR